MLVIKNNCLYTLYQRKSNIIKPKYFIFDKQEDKIITTSNNKKHILSCWKQIHNIGGRTK